MFTALDSVTTEHHGWESLDDRTDQNMIQIQHQQPPLVTADVCASSAIQRCPRTGSESQRVWLEA